MINNYQYLNFSQFLTQSYCMHSEERMYHMDHFYESFCFFCNTF